MDAGYGNNTGLRARIAELELSYVADISSNVTVWAPGTGPLPPKPWSGRGRPPKRLQRDGEHWPVPVKELALALLEQAWHRIEWREATNERLSSRFARVRVRVAQPDHGRAESRPEEWLLIEWPEGQQEPTKYWLSTLPADIPFDRLVDLAKPRWRIERDYQELKQEVGLGHFEGRGWRGFHHHATLCIAAYGFLICERQTIPPSGLGAAKGLPPPAVPRGDRPRGATAAARTPTSGGGR
jgi:SRSO17 transposase